MFQGFPYDCVHDGHGPVVDEISGELSLGCFPVDYFNLLSDPLGVNLRTCSSSDCFMVPLDGCIWIVGTILAHNLGVRDLVTAVVEEIFVSDDPESISSLGALLFGAFRDLTYTLAQASQFIGI